MCDISTQRSTKSTKRERTKCKRCRVVYVNVSSASELLLTRSRELGDSLWSRCWKTRTKWWFGSCSVAECAILTMFWKYSSSDLQKCVVFIHKLTYIQIEKFCFRQRPQNKWISSSIHEFQSRAAFGNLFLMVLLGLCVVHSVFMIKTKNEWARNAPMSILLLHKMKQHDIYSAFILMLKRKNKNINN